MINTFRGWLGEKAAQFGVWLTLDSATYRPFHDLVLRYSGSTTQIDHVLLSRFGLFVVETKNYRGWIYGKEGDAQWTQVLHGSRRSFQNPLRQNYRHVRALAEALRVDEAAIRPVVLFIGSAELKTPLPGNVLTGGLAFYIQQFREEVFDAAEVRRIGRELERLKETAPPGREHVRNLKERHTGSTCPRCGGQLVRRTARKGPRAGEEFTGCSAYPKCRYVRESPPG